MITAAADGSSLGNPGPTGWGWYIDADRWAAGGQRQGTNNIGELSAVIDLLQQTVGVDELHVLCDSQYVIKAITQWMPGWKRKGWRKADGKPVMNRELLEELDRLMTARRAAGGTVTFEWVKGHAGHPLNEAADRLANGAAAAYQRGRVPDAGPGFAGAGASVPPQVEERAGAPSQVEERAGAAGTRLETDTAPSQVEERAGAAGTRHETDTAAPQVEERAGAAGTRLETDTAPTSQTDTVDLFDGLDFLVDEPAEAEVVRLERSLLTDEVRADPASVAALLHPEWEEIGASGRRWSRDELLAEIAPLPSPVELELLATHEVAPDAQLVVWRSVGEAPALRSSLWVRSGGRWRQRFHQGTPER
ncbi:ribonuclease HI family protein [Agrococcus carbonis]|uniref:Ribonuclease H n=1 Tax=Agrococcus carbonis TaxID=684552 RepID=A0A1H1SBA8_9MICO|nr:ribonuclease HI family protein [Agrococcus carbonis]SDS45265.1 ribonuclease HI [Agrococcus carbonis]